MVKYNNLLCIVVAHDVDPEAVGGRGRREGAHPQRRAVVRRPVVGRCVVSAVRVTRGPVFPAGGRAWLDWTIWKCSIVHKIPDLLIPHLSPTSTHPHTLHL